MNAQTQLDDVFFQIYKEMCQNICKSSADSAKTILEHSSQYLSSQANKALNDFYNLYFSQNDALDANKNEIKDDVDSIFEEAMALIESGGDISSMSLEEDGSDIAERRNALSGIQRELEAIIRTEEGIREKVLPVLTSMQFEDAMRQRVEHLQEMWLLMSAEFKKPNGVDIEEYLNFVSSLPSSTLETEQFYRIVRKEEVPADKLDDSADLFEMF